MSESSGSGKRGIGELAEDAVGFGGAELRLTRDLLIRPRAVMDAYDAHGPTAGGLYPKPLRYWLTLNGLILLFMAVTGALERSMETGGASDEAFSKMARRAGKTLEEFRGDLEQWMSMVMLPVYALTIGGALFLLIRRWSPADDRQDFRQTFTFLNAWSLWTLPFGLVSIMAPVSQDVMMWASFAVMFLSIPLVYAVFGAGRWWRTPRGAWLKGALLLLVSMVAFVPYSAIAGALAFAGAFFLP